MCTNQYVSPTYLKTLPATVLLETAAIGRSEYRASEADCEAWGLALRPKQCLLATHERLRTISVPVILNALLPSRNQP